MTTAIERARAQALRAAQGGEDDVPVVPPKRPMKTLASTRTTHPSSPIDDVRRAEAALKRDAEQQRQRMAAAAAALDVDPADLEELRRQREAEARVQAQQAQAHAKAMAKVEAALPARAEALSKEFDATLTRVIETLCREVARQHLLAEAGLRTTSAPMPTPVDLDRVLRAWHRLSA